MDKVSRSPLVCICVPTYNSEGTLAETLESILGQSYSNLVVRVVDNASTDNTLKIADRYAAADARVRVYRNSENVGGEGNFTRCLGLACGDYTAIFHSDDIYTPEMVAKQVAFLRSNPQAGAVFSMAQSIDERGVLGREYRLPAEVSKGSGALYDFDEIFRALLKYGNDFLFCPSAMARTPIYRDHIRKWDAGGFNTSADLDVWLRILMRTPVGIIEEPLLRYRGGAASSFSYTAAREKTGRHDMLRVLDFYSKGYAAPLVGPEEAADYAIIELKDSINRAFNLFVIGDRAAGRGLLGGIFKPSNLLHALKNRFHLKIMLHGYIVYPLLCLPLPEKARHAVCRARFGGFKTL